MRTFEDLPAKRTQVPAWIGIVGPSGSGKTWSALRLATGMQRVTGGDVFGIDTEARRMNHYADYFKFRHVEFIAPFGSLDYLAAIDHCYKKGAKTIIIDSASHQHEGQGGMLEQQEQEFQRLGGQDSKKFLSWVKPKGDERKLVNAMLQMKCNFIVCFRAKEKIKPVPGKQPLILGWQPIASESWIFEMTANFLLPPGSKGVPQWTPEQPAERAMIKLPTQFQALFSQSRALDEEHGEAIAKWASGATIQTAPPKTIEVQASKQGDFLK